MAVIFLEPGTDATQDFTFYGGTNPTGSSTITSDNTQSQDGPRSIKSLATPAGSQANIFTPNNVISDAGALMSGWFRFSTVAPATITLFMSASQATNGSLILGVGLNSNGTLHFSGRGTTQKDGSTVLSANTWYRISIGYIITSVSNWSATLYINGASEATTSNADGNLLLASTSCVGLGVNLSSQGGFASPAAMTIWVDSIYIDNRTDKTDCGNVHVTAKRSFSNGTTNGYTTQIGSGGSGYGTGHAPQVNERPLSTTNGWSMIGAGSAITEEYNIEGVSVGDVDITGATIVDYMGWLYSKSALSETGKIIVNNVSTNISLTSTNTMFTKAAGSSTYPAGTGKDIGEITSTTVTTVSLYEAGVIVAYIPAVGGSSIKTINGLAKASVKTIEGLAIASAKTWNGLA